MGRGYVMRGAAQVSGTSIVKPPLPGSDDAFYFGSGGAGGGAGGGKSGDGSNLVELDGLYDSHLDVDEEYLRAYQKVDE